MPKFLEKKLKAEYGQKSKIPYKVMNSIGAMRGSKETAKGKQMEAKHDAKVQGVDPARFVNESHSYDFKRPKRKVVSRYS